MFLLSVILVVLIYIACRNPETVVISAPANTANHRACLLLVAVQNSLPPYTIDDIHWAQKGRIWDCRW